MRVTVRGAVRHLLCTAIVLAPLATSAAVFINEIHYDNTGSDTGERIEVVATAGESLGTYRIYLYNGATPSAATYYDNDPLPAGSTVTCGGGGSVRIATLSYAANGIQNGAPDAIALVNGSGQLVQFLSYEGTVTGANGPAAGRNSTDLPVAENESPTNTSLQLGGSGSGYANFTWRASATQTFGACNNAQTFSAPNPPPTVVSTSPADGATGVAPATDLGVTFSEAVTLTSGAFALQCTQSGAVSLTYPASGTSFTITTGTTLAGSENCTFTVDATKVTDSGGAKLAQNEVVGFAIATSGGTGYYAHVNTSSASQLRCSLHETIKNHTAYPYSASTTDTWDILEIADEDPNAAGRILDIYRNRSYLKGSERAGTGTGLTYNREHTWPNSLGFGSTIGDKGLPYSPYTDTHMLYLSDTTWNADRGNKPYAGCTLASGCGERLTEANNGFGGGSGVYPGNSNWVKGPDGNAGSFEVWGHRKGDIARAVLYMAIRYEGGVDQNGQGEPDLEVTDDRSKIVITSASPAYMGLLSTLLAWHQADPPDAGESERNEVIYSFQGNRNPFIDHPEWATSALFTSSEPASCQLK